MKLAIGAVYSVFSRNGCVVSFSDGTECLSVPAEEVRLLLAQEEEMEVSDPAAIVSIVPNGAEVLHGVMMSSYSADKLPAGYRRVEYLLGDGKQRVHTDFYPTSQSGIEMDFCVMEETSVSFWPFGNGDTGRNDEPDKKFSLLYTHDRTYPRGIFYLGGALAQAQIFALAGTRQLLKVADGIVSAGRGSMSAPSANFVGVTELTICSHVRQANAMRVQWYGCKLYETAIEQRNLVPAIDPTGSPCMFDLVSRKPFYNSGTGDFTYPGKEMQATTYSLRRRDYAQMTEHGIRRLYHVPQGCELSKEEYAEQNGFKILVETPAPEEGYWTPVWHEREDCIELEWVETEPPIEELSTET